jgi:hypothetical protein
VRWAFLAKTSGLWQSLIQGPRRLCGPLPSIVGWFDANAVTYTLFLILLRQSLFRVAVLRLILGELFDFFSRNGITETCCFFQCDLEYFTWTPYTDTVPIDWVSGHGWLKGKTEPHDFPVRRR